MSSGCRTSKRSVDQANELARFAKHVVVVPKDPAMAERLDELIPAFPAWVARPESGGTMIPPDKSFDALFTCLLAGVLTTSEGWQT